MRLTLLPVPEEMGTCRRRSPQIVPRIRDIERLTEALSDLETDGLAAQIERLTHRIKADLSA